MAKIKKLQAAVGQTSGDAPQSPASTAPSAAVAVPGNSLWTRMHIRSSLLIYQLVYIFVYMKYMNLFSKLSAHIGAFYVATGPGSYAAGAPAGSTASEPVMSLAISIKND